MSDCLVYGKYYWKELKKQRCDPDTPNSKEIASPFWRSKSEDFLMQAYRGDSLWVIVLGEEGHRIEWRLLQRIVLTENPSYKAEYKNTEYGAYAVQGNPKKSKVFRIIGQPDLTVVLRMLEFKSGKTIRVNGKQIGNLIETIRPLSHGDSVLLERYAGTLDTI